MVAATAARSWWDQDAQTKPVGGYRLIPLPHLCAAWMAYFEGGISRAALNAWFALQELAKRREFTSHGRTPKYRIRELERLIGGGEERARRALRELVRSELVQCSPASLTFHIPEAASAGVEEMLELLDIRGRGDLVPVPREVLKLLAGGATKARTATLLGHALRVLHGGGRKPVRRTGLVKASTIAEAFGISERSVKRERRALIELGLLERADTPQWVMNRHGIRMVWNLEWRRPVDNCSVGEGRSANRCTELSPPAVENEPVLSPLGDNGNLPTEGRTQTSASRQAASLNHGSSTKKQKAQNPKHLTPADLRSDDRLQQLFEREVAAGTLTDDPAAMVEFFAAAEHALAVGANPCGLFVETVKSFQFRRDPPPDLPRKKRYWTFITQADEDAGRARVLRIQSCSNGPPRRGDAKPEQPRNNRRELSPDARLVGQLRRENRGRNDDQILTTLRFRHPEWTEERWLRAAVELATQHHRPPKDDAIPDAKALLASFFPPSALQGGAPENPVRAYA